MSEPKRAKIPRYEPRARSIGGPWKMVKCKDGPYVCHEQHAEIVAALAADKQAADRATFDAIRAFTVLKDENARLKAENEVLRKKVDWLQQAEKLIIWDGQQWKVRHEVPNDEMKKRADTFYDLAMKNIGELSVERERVKELLFRVKELKKHGELMAKAAIAYMGDSETSTFLVATADRMYYCHDDKNSIENYLQSDTRIS